ncbi:cupin-like domain-containing protein [Moraxella sp. Tifton1]|uniref:cupin domain-containing protein n=1 Tax=Moraxella oculi TaxID=2940516 RepID=UPI0020133B59|nr:cupin domain-containing protein [Moraxella sp. Tifton1]MCL1624304.1 cupin-like domain-containing protein [Moraxella sp. Tifton1]
MNKNFEKLEFLDNYQDKKLLLSKKCFETDGLTWEKINEIIERNNINPDEFKIAYQGIVEKHHYLETYDEVGMIRHRLIKPIIYNLLKNGATLIANRIINEPAIDKFARQIAQLTGRQTVASMYVAFGDKDSCKAHWDTRDVFAVQLMGKKHWALYQPNFESPLYMQQSKDVDVPEPTIPDMEVVLEAGDVLYIPRGWWHNPVPMGCETFHLAIGTFAPTGYDYMEWLTKQMPNILPLRYNLSDWETDKNNIAQACTQLSAMMTDPVMYDRFMQEFLGNHRLDTRFNMELFGNPNNDKLPPESRLSLNVVDIRTLDKGYLISNGTKINVDELSKKFINIIINHQPIALSEVLTHFDKAQHEHIQKLAYDLANFDIMDVLR